MRPGLRPALRFQASGLALIWHRLTPDVSQAKLILIKVPVDALWSNLTRILAEENDYAENTLDWRNLDRGCSACSNSGFSQMVRTSEYIKHCAGY
jgi:hypothetical protein